MEETPEPDLVVSLRGQSLMGDTQSQPSGITVRWQNFSSHSPYDEAWIWACSNDSALGERAHPT